MEYNQDDSIVKPEHLQRRRAKVTSMTLVSVGYNLYQVQ